MKYVACFILTISFMLNSAYAQPLRHSDNDWSLEEQSIDWDPVPIEVTTGDLSLRVWLLRRLVPAPESGYLITRSDWIEIRRMLDSLSEEVQRVKNFERSSCDKRLKEKDSFCQNINKDLIKEIEILTKNEKVKAKEISSLKKENLWTKIITGTAILGLSGLSIYQATK